jgi:hypothetical protein
MKLFAATALAVLLPLSVSAQVCAPRENAVDYLGLNFGESRQAVGLEGGGSMVEVFANIETGSWTIIFTNADMVSCFVASGGNFEGTPTEPAPQGEAG